MYTIELYSLTQQAFTIINILIRKLYRLYGSTIHAQIDLGLICIEKSRHHSYVQTRNIDFDC